MLSIRQYATSYLDLSKKRAWVRRSATKALPQAKHPCGDKRCLQTPQPATALPPQILQQILGQLAKRLQEVIHRFMALFRIGLDGLHDRAREHRIELGNDFQNRLRLDRVVL